MTAEVLRVRGESDGTNTLAAYYEVGLSTFRARLRPVGDGDGLELTTVEQVRIPVYADDDLDYNATEVVREEPVELVPNVVRDAVDRPVQVPTEGDHA